MSKPRETRTEENGARVAETDVAQAVQVRHGAASISPVGINRSFSALDARKNLPKETRRQAAPAFFQRLAAERQS
jgi:hypothetical protein